MCGLAGVAALDGSTPSPAVVARMAEALQHRGPDGEGVLCDQGVGFGHRRLAVIDLTPAGHQPMMTVDGRGVLVYNGEVFNFLDLRAELEAYGHQFRSRCDAEVVLLALRQWGPDAIARFNGMFALAYHDREHRQLVLARDRYGVKPLYYTRVGQAILFASEVKAFLRYPGFRARVDDAGLFEYFTFQNFLSDRTLFDGVRLLPPGSVLTVDLGLQKEPQVRRYWVYQFEEPESTPVDDGQYAEELTRLFEQAVRRQLVSDVPIGSYLSGGIDTGAITAVASRQLGDIPTFTVGFDLSSASGLELGFDERAQAERLSYLFQTEHYEMVLKAGDMERAMTDLVWHLEEPRVGQSYPNYYAAKLASRFVKVVLSGAGGDELFAGYPWRYYRGATGAGFEGYLDSYFGFWQRLVPTELAGQMFAPLAGRIDGLSAREMFEAAFIHPAVELSRPEDYINQSLYFEAHTFLHSLLVVEDKLSMTYGLECRVPFLDNDLVEFAMRLPVRTKLGDLTEPSRIDENDPKSKLDRTRTGKQILRRVLGRYVPADVAGAPKQGFSGPDASWFRGESIEYVRRQLLKSDARIFNFLDRQTVHSLVTDHLDGRVNRRLLVWSLLCFEHWCEQFL